MTQDVDSPALSLPADDWDGPAAAASEDTALYLELDGWEGPLDLGIVGDFRMKHDDVEARRHAADLIINGLSFQERLVPEKQIMYLSLR